MKIEDLKIGSEIVFWGCKTCVGKFKCFFCKKGVKPIGKVSDLWLDYEIPTVGVQVKGSEDLLELTQADLDDPLLVKKFS